MVFLPRGLAKMSQLFWRGDHTAVLPLAWCYYLMLSPMPGRSIAWDSDFYCRCGLYKAHRMLQTVGHICTCWGLGMWLGVPLMANRETSSVLRHLLCMGIKCAKVYSEKTAICRHLSSLGSWVIHKCGNHFGQTVCQPGMSVEQSIFPVPVRV